MENIDYSEYNSVDRSYHEMSSKMYRYMVHIKPYIINKITKTNDKKAVSDVITVYANLTKTFGEMLGVTNAHMPNIEFKKKFFNDTSSLFDRFLVEYKKLMPEDDMKFTQEEMSLRIN